MTQEETDITIDRLLDGWEEALHIVDSLWQVVQTVPDWESKLRNAWNDPFRVRMTREGFSPVREAIREMRAGVPGIESLDKALEKLNKTH